MGLTTGLLVINQIIIMNINRGWIIRNVRMIIVVIVCCLIVNYIAVHLPGWIRSLSKH